MSNEKKIDFSYTAVKYIESADIYVLETENASASILDSNFEAKLTGIVNQINEYEEFFISLVDKDNNKLKSLVNKFYINEENNTIRYPIGFRTTTGNSISPSIVDTIHVSIGLIISVTISKIGEK